MTTRLKGFTVVLEEDMREDDAEPLRLAIAQMRGVLSVAPVEKDIDDYFAMERVRRELGMKLWEILYPKEKE